MDLTPPLPWVAGFGALFLAVFAVFGFFVLRFIWRCFREVEKGHERFRQMGRAWPLLKSNLPLRSVRHHSERVRADVEAFDRDFERRFRRGA
ncbi:hypothetical protein ACP4J4_01800 [Aureimonas ureilytica]|uniref:hypothetical protein n=1 Tax=Aureimonas ureilytica TaxID=401562 RepID=UPI003CE815B1